MQMKQEEYKVRLSRQKRLKKKLPKDKLKLTYTISDFYKDYKKTGVVPLTKAQYTTICKSFLEEVSLAIIREKYEFRIPSRLGFLRVVKRKAKNKAVDFVNTKKYGKTIRHHNFHTDQYYFTFKWMKGGSYCYFTNKSYYSFSVVDDKRRRKIGRRGLAQWIQTCATDPTKKDYDTIML